MDGPVHADVQPVCYFIFGADAQGHVGGKYILPVSLHKGGSQAAKHEGHQPFGSAIVPACAVRPEVILKHQAHIYQRVVEGVRCLLIVGIVGFHLVGRTFQFAECQVEPQVLVWVEIISAHDGSHRLLVGKDIAVQVAFVSHQTNAHTYLHAILRVVLCPCPLHLEQEAQQQQEVAQADFHFLYLIIYIKMYLVDYFASQGWLSPCASHRCYSVPSIRNRCG